MTSNARILLLDIETAPILGWVWKIWEENMGLNQIKQDTHLLSFAAKWLGESGVIYSDQRNEKRIEDDKKLLKQLWGLLDRADIVIGHNSKQFDTKVVNTRFVINGMIPPSGYKQIDTLQLVKNKFRFTSNKLEYLSNQLCEKHKKFKHGKFSGFELWKECLAGNPAAWKEMEKYNKIDVLALEELYNKLQPWDNSFNPEVYADSKEMLCACGSRSFQRRGFRYTGTGKFQAFRCNQCGAEKISRINLLPLDKRKHINR